MSFPRSEDRGPIEAFNADTANHQPAYFSRSEDRGPIEASVCPWDNRQPPPSFLDQKIEAPLKPLKACTWIRRAAAFLDQKIEAPLKPSSLRMVEREWRALSSIRRSRPH